MTIDIHKYTKRLQSAENCIRKSKTSERNKQILFEFEHHLLATGISKARVIKYLCCLKKVTDWMDKDFDKATKADLMQLVKRIRVDDNYSPSTIQGYCVIIKRFYKYLWGNDEEYPKDIRWIPTTIPRKDKVLPGEGDLLTEDDIKKVLDCTRHPRDKALISMLFESGCRIGELASMRLRHINIDEHGVLLSVSGKTGSRQIRIVSSTGFLMNWLSVHPLKDDKEAPLWARISIGKKDRNSFLSYRSVNKVIKEAFKRAGINKRVYPHLFRHSRATIMASHLTEFQMNQYFGWVQGSNMPSTYVHLSGRDLDGALLKFNGIAVDKTKNTESKLKPRICPRCTSINEYDSDYCKKCTAILDEKLRVEIEEKQRARDKMDKMMDLLMQDPSFKEMMVERMKEL